MTLAQINRRIQEHAPHVELVRGEGYHYYVFDRAADAHHPLIWETRSVMVPYLKDQTPQRWIDDGWTYEIEMKHEHGINE